jgi:hypothetical protein
MMRRSWWGIVAALVAGTACTNAGESFQVAALTTGSIQVAVYFDRDGSASLTAADTVFAGVRVALVVPGGPDTLRTVLTNAQGIATFDSLPVGSYRIVIDRHALADSVGVVAGDTGTIRLVSESDSLHLGSVIRLGYPEVTLAGVRALPAGHRVLVHARVTSPLQAFRDSSAFLFDSSGALRVTGAQAQLGSGGNNIGDSVIVIGTTGQRSGQGVLQNGLFRFIVAGLAPLPRISTITESHTAKGGTLDAALIQLSNVVITDTLTSGPDFMLMVADPADTTVKTSILLDQLLNAPHGVFPPGRTGTFRGVLVPVGDGTWVLKPRNGADIVLN